MGTSVADGVRLVIGKRDLEPLGYGDFLRNSDATTYE
jgi:hypothetical protein